MRQKKQVASDTQTDKRWTPPKKRLDVRRGLRKMETAFGHASRFADSFHKCAQEPSVFNVAKTIFDITCQVSQMFLINYYEYFQGWSSPYTDDYNYAIVEVLKSRPYVDKATNDQNISLRRVKITDAEGEFELYYCINMEHESIEGIHVKNENVERCRNFIKDAFWDSFGDQFLLMHKKRVFDHGREIGEFLIFDSDNEVEPHMSQRAREIGNKTKRFLDNDISRSILLYGPPGTGKSTMVRAIVKNLGLSSLRIRVEDLEDMTNATIFEAIKIFEPECIIIDDLDRATRLSHLLEMLERFNKKLKLVFATVNDKEVLGDAILRPGRFDELIEIKDLDEETVRKILLDEDETVFAIVKSWPISYILEYLKRRTYMSRDDALADLTELRKRVRQLEGYDDDEIPGKLAKELKAMRQSGMSGESLKRAKHLIRTTAKKQAIAELLGNGNSEFVEPDTLTEIEELTKQIVDEEEEKENEDLD